MAKTYEVKIYSIHDCDLYSIHMLYEFNFSKAIYCALNAFLKKQTVVIKMPPKRKRPIERRRFCATKLILDEEKNAKLIQLLEGIQTGYRNNFIKNILRMYLQMPCTEAFFKAPEEYDKTVELLKPLSDGKKVINAAGKRKGKGRASTRLPIRKEKETAVGLSRSEIQAKQLLEKAALNTGTNSQERPQKANDEEKKQELRQSARYALPDETFSDHEGRVENNVPSEKKTKRDDYPDNEAKQQDITNILFNIISSQ